MRFSLIFYPIAGVILLSACGTTPPPEPHGKWRPVNRFPTQTQAIPLSSSYTYFVTPMDGTLKSLLTRWAHDSNVQLQYGVSMDFTLHAPAAQIHTANMADALAQLSALYRAHGIEIQSSPGLIVVTAVQAPADADGSTDASN